MHRLGEGLDFEQSVVNNKKFLKPNVLGLSLKSPLKYKPGQYLQLASDSKGSNTRCYSLASHPKVHDELHFHIKIVPDGVFSQYLTNDISSGDSLFIKGPLGDCVYAADAEKTLILSAIGTGLAPIFGVLTDALVNDDVGDIHVCVGAKTTKGFYFYDQLIDICQNNTQVFLHLISMSDD